MRNSRRFLKKRSIKSGLPPGTLVHIGDVPEEKATIELIGYSPENFLERGFSTVSECMRHVDAAQVSWINVEGVHDMEIIHSLGVTFSFHPLMLEDIANTSQRPKIEEYSDHLFIVLRMLHTADEGGFASEQLSIVLGPGYVITFQEGIKGDVFESLRNRIRNAKGNIRGMGADYLAYALMDAIVDSYFNVIEGVGERIVNAEEELAVMSDRSTLHNINEMKKEIIYLRKSVWPLREVISFLERGDSDLVSKTTRVYFRDVYDHTVQVIDTIETYRDLLSGMLDLYLSSMSNRTNEIMKFLTVIGTIFIPLTFLVGVYGMNFKYMPELEWPLGYFCLWGFMIVIALSMVCYFRSKRWL